MTDMKTIYTLWIITAGQQCAARTYKMLRYFEDPKTAFETAAQNKLDRTVFNEQDRMLFRNKSLKKAQEIFEYCNKKHIRIITYYDSDYPENLRQIICPPVALFVRGTLPEQDMPAITIVGTRKCTQEGAKLTAQLAYGASRSGICVVSGLANGIDTYAHKGCLYAKTSPTVAILPSSLDSIYPPENRALSELIVQNGALISEILPGTSVPGKWSFLLRNRLLSAFSQSTLVVQSYKNGGSLITANHAVEQNKTVFAVPGFPLQKASAGTNELIKAGATPCTGLQDLYNFYVPLFGNKIKQLNKVKGPELSPDQQRIYDALTQPLTAEDLCQKTGLPFFEVAQLVSEMEAQRLIQTEGNYYKAKQI